jgi:hypothetical protein
VVPQPGVAYEGQSHFELLSRRSREKAKRLPANSAIDVFNERNRLGDDRAINRGLVVENNVKRVEAYAAAWVRQ